jgi:quercetin dioxygenase-like cupin family protein
MSHPGEELVLVTEGSLVFDVAGTRFELGPGDSLHFIGDQPHHWANETEKQAAAVRFALRDS